MEAIRRVPQPVIAKVHGDRDGSRLSAGRRLRPGGRRRGRPLRHSRREDRPVLLDADGAAVPRDRPQARDGDAAHRPADRRRRRRSTGASSTASSRRRSSTPTVTSIVDASCALQPADRRYRQGGFYPQIELDERRAYDLTKAVMAMNARAADAQEGICAFLEKRPATWRSSH